MPQIKHCKFYLLLFTNLFLHQLGIVFKLCDSCLEPFGHLLVAMNVVNKHLHVCKQILGTMDTI